MGIKFSQAELKSLIKEVETGLGEIMKAETAKLAKAADESAPKAPEKKESSEAPAKDESAPAESAPAAEEAPEATDAAPAEEAPAPGADAPADAAPEEVPAEAPVAQPEVTDHATLVAEMKTMPMPHVKAVYLAAKQALMEGQAAPAAEAPQAPMAPDAAPAAAPEAPAAPAASAPAASPAAAPEAPPELGKAAVEMKKSLDSAAAKIQALEAQVVGLLKVAELTVGKPRQRAITDLTGAVLTKSEAPLSREEVLKKLKAKASTLDIKKSDREAINAFATNPSASVELVKHLLA